MPPNGLHRFSVHAGATPVPAEPGNPEPASAARQHLRALLQPGATTTFRLLGTEHIPATGTRVVKFRQMHQKVTVYGSLITVELRDDNALLCVNASLGNPAKTSCVARMPPDGAWKKLVHPAKTRLTNAPRTCYFFDPSGKRWRLVYLFEDVPGPGTRSPVADCFVDAHTGRKVAELPRIATAWRSVQETAVDGLGVMRTLGVMVDDAGKRRLEDGKYNVHTHDFAFRDLNVALLPGSYAAAPPAWSPAAVSAHANAIQVAAFLKDVLGRQGVDGLGGPIVSSICCIRTGESSDGRQWHTAAWTGSQMVYGQRTVADGSLQSYSVGLDVVAHEMFHGVTDGTARLQYAGEPGALNESYSDIFGILISNYHTADRKQWNWDVGETLPNTHLPARSIQNPRAHGQPDHMRDFRRLPMTPKGDFGGVHINSGIHNAAGYRIMSALDATGQPLFNATALASLFYLAVVHHLSRTSQFTDSRQALTLVAQTLFQSDPPSLRQARLAAITRAFDDVGIPAPAPPPPPVLRAMPLQMPFFTALKPVAITPGYKV